ncbi:MAG TPA: hypothetical protein DD671_12525 [Balneolaceae bacterium]|nr:hypothetical protein [Balneola sp.]HBQ60411.1 hypothetical protein [Balneolaceae bacterium]|tara:strand:+ start:19483 stop:19809 length:327 start_codon:yes stop_codon:yes gene_type:complete
MAWIKDAVVDIIILLFIVAYAISLNSVLQVILWVYTGLLFISKVLALFMPSLQRRANNTQVPIYVYHIIYILTLGTLIYIGDFYFAAAWGIIWVLSVIQYISSNKKKS